MNDQLPLEVRLRTDQNFENFKSLGNEQLLTQLQNVHTVHPGLYLFSGEGNGKSHLLSALCNEYQKQFPENRLAYLQLKQSEFPPEALEGFEQCQLLCIDDIDRVFGDQAWETALFQLLNAMWDREHTLVVSASASLQSQPLGFADLHTRLGKFVQFELKALPDDQQMQVFKERAREKGMKIDDDVLNYIAQRGPRSMSDRMGLLNELDTRSLQAKRLVTIPFLKEFVKW